MTTKEIATSIYTIRKAQSMFTTLIRVMDIIKERKEITNVELQSMFPRSIQTMVDALECCGKIHHENRKEETITIDRRGYHAPLDENGFEIQMHDAETITVSYEGKELTIPNPFKAHTKYEYGDYKIKIQVTRKYWQWVE